MLKKRTILSIGLSTLLLFQNLSFTTVLAKSNTAVKTADYTSVVSRIYGSDRFATSLDIAKNGWSKASNVIIATGLNFPDAMSASALSKSKDAPIILTNPNSLSQDIIDELIRLGVSNAYVIGGTGVIKPNIEAQLGKLGIKVTRLGGTSRYATSLQVAQQIGVTNGITVATGNDFPDAISVAPIASIKSMPILLSSKQGLDSDTAAYLKGKNIPAAYIIGGTGVLNASLDSISGSKRLSGGNRYATNLAINNEFSSSLNFDTVYLATGRDFPDALSGSALAAKNGSPIILVDKNSISTDTLNFLKSKNVRHVVILGGTGVVSQTVEDTLNTELLVKAASVSLNKTSDTLAVGSTDTLTASVSPSNATNKTVSWSSSNTGVATVDSTGKIIGVAAGLANVIATTADGGFTASCSVTITSQDIDITSKFTDPNFKAEVYSDIGKSAPAPILYSDVKNITDMNVSDLNISSLNGIEYFDSLKNLNCSFNVLTALDVSHNTNLIELDCSSYQGDNKIKSLDVSHNTALTGLYCSGNALTTLDLSHNTNLVELDCSNNQDGNSKLKSIDVSHNTALTKLYCNGNALTTLDLSHNTALTTLYCRDNALAALDVSHNTNLTELDCSNYQGGNKLNFLDVSHNTALTTLYCTYNALTALDLSHNTALTTLNCRDNALAVLDLSHNTALTTVDCRDNALTVND